MTETKHILIFIRCTCNMLPPSTPLVWGCRTLLCYQPNTGRHVANISVLRSPRLTSGAIKSGVPLKDLGRESVNSFFEYPKSQILRRGFSGSPSSSTFCSTPSRLLEVATSQELTLLDAPRLYLGAGNQSARVFASDNRRCCRDWNGKYTAGGTRSN